MVDCPQPPPLDGSVSILPGFVDFHALHNPHHPWAYLPTTSGSKPCAISFGELARASHRIAYTLRPCGTGVDGAVVGVLVQCDSLLYVALLIGMTRAGLVVSTSLGQI